MPDVAPELRAVEVDAIEDFIRTMLRLLDRIAERRRPRLRTVAAKERAGLT